MLGATLGANDYLERVCAEIRRLDPTQLETLSDLIEEAYHAGRFVFICGNGGSARTLRTYAKTWPSAPCATSRTRNGSRSLA